MGCPRQTPLPMPLVQSQANGRLPGKPPSLPVTQPHGRLSPLLLLIGHDQARVQDVLFWLPRAVPGRETREVRAALPPHWIHRGRGCSTRAHYLKPSPPRSCPWSPRLGQGPPWGSSMTRTPLVLTTGHATYKCVQLPVRPHVHLRSMGCLEEGRASKSRIPFLEEARVCGKGRDSEPGCLGSNPTSALASCRTLNDFLNAPLPLLLHV